MAYNRGKLKRDIIKGLYLAKRNHRYTDDYAWDAATNFGATEFMPAAYFPSFWLWLEETGRKEEYNKTLQELNEKEEYIEVDRYRRKIGDLYSKERDEATKGAMTFDESDFRGYGSAYQNEDGTITLSFGFESFDFKLK